MKIILFTIVFSFLSCSTKYQHLGTINKKAFIEKDEMRDTKKRLTKGRTDNDSFCIGQILFQKNAFDITESSLKSLIRSSCPGDEYLQHTVIKRTWWTTLVYSRSCIEIEALCTR